MKTISRILMPTALLFLWSCDTTQQGGDEGGPPEVTILSPAGGSAIHDTTDIQVDGLDAAGRALDRIVYYVDDAAAYTDPAPTAGSPASVWRMPTVDFGDGSREVRVAGYDSEGRSSEDQRTYTVTNVDAVSGVVSTTGSGSFTTFSGAGIAIPVGAVPSLESGNPATTVFSIELDTETAILPPEGEGLASNVYKFGPGNFVFARPVQVTLPLMDGVNPDVVSVYRINPTTGAHEYFAGEYDMENRAVTAQTFQLSSWFLTNSAPRSEGPGYIEINNLTGGCLTLCVSSASLAFPARDAQHTPELGWMSQWSASDGEVGLSQSGGWWLPQGSYTVCVQVEQSGGIFEQETRTINVNTAADRSWGGEPTPSVTITGFEDEPVIPGECPCLPTPTVPVGTGDIQATLQWFNQSSIDLDLWIYEPDGERCYFANPITPNGGELDRDNLCGNYENGTPENIFYQNPPSGEYSVWVHWWSDCGNGQPSQDFSVRLVIPTGTTTYEATIFPNDTVEVVRFEIGGAGTQASPNPRPFSQSDVFYRSGDPKPDINALKQEYRQIQ